MKRYIISLIALIAATGLNAQTLNLSLQDCRQMAIANNEKVKTADNAVEKANLDKQIAFAQYFPKVDGSATGLFMKDQDLLGWSLQLRGAYLAGINVTMPLYVGGQISTANQLALRG